MIPKNVLYDVAAALDEYQADHPDVKNFCLGSVRICLQKYHLYLPRFGVDFHGHDWAIDCGTYLAKHPVETGKRAWRLLGTTAAAIPNDQPSLVFFRDCGELANGGMAGHVGIYKPSTNHIVSDMTEPLSDWWRERVAYVFLPVFE